VEVTPEYKIELARELRQRQTTSEARLWSLLRGNGVAGLKFRRQRPIGRFVADFCCESLKLVVEVDGEYHETEQQKEWDQEREAHFIGRGYTILRFTNHEVMHEINVVVRRLQETAVELTTKDATIPPSAGNEPTERYRPPSPASGEGLGVRAARADNGERHL
jgi:very-short-patch-repair endonuclease